MEKQKVESIKFGEKVKAPVQFWVVFILCLLSVFGTPFMMQFNFPTANEITFLDSIVLILFFYTPMVIFLYFLKKGFEKQEKSSLTSFWFFSVLGMSSVLLIPLWVIFDMNLYNIRNKFSGLYFDKNSLIEILSITISSVAGIMLLTFKDLF
jgi:hypothetical protein